MKIGIGTVTKGGTTYHAVSDGKCIRLYNLNSKRFLRMVPPDVYVEFKLTNKGISNEQNKINVQRWIQRW